MKNSSFLKILFLILFTGCSLQNQKDYDKLLAQDVSDLNEVVKKITEFEIAHPKHFESKVFLAEYYFASGDYNNADNYLKRADAVKKYAARGAKNDNYAKLYAYNARLAFFTKDYDSVIKNATIGLKYDKDNAYRLEYLIGHAYVATQNDEEAIKYFDNAYKKYPEQASENDLRAYMYLLNGADRMDECKVIINKFFETGKWFYGFGAFCSLVYEKTGNIQESLFYAFMDYEYLSSVGPSDDEKFIENLKNVEAALKNNGNYEIAKPAFNLILGIYTNNHDYSGNITPCLISDYLIIRHKIMTKEVTQEDFNILLGMEKYLCSFPVYYWSIWQTVRIIDVNASKNFLPVLKKIIALSPTSKYSQMARNEITKVFGVKVDDNTDLDLLLFN